MSSAAPGLVPGCGGAWTVKASASASRNGFQWRPQGPWKKTRLGPEPFVSTRMRTRPCQTERVRAWMPFRVDTGSTPSPCPLPHWGRGMRRRGDLFCNPLPHRGRGQGEGAVLDLGALAQLLWPPVVDPALVLPEAAEGGEDFAGEEIHVLQGQLVGHGADLQQHHQVADAEALDHLFLEALAHGGGAARDDVALLD